MIDLKYILKFTDCKAITGLKQNCQVIAGQRQKNCKEILGLVIFWFTVHGTRCKGARKAKGKAQSAGIFVARCVSAW
ncbi:hypothetical protein FACS189421_01670 [Bacteroidia bacterium]|nr:hypothetical protein FACS189421_01670 [Bacteroidia bacterium]GHT49771.1 hypothetical protein FACS189440_16050 [Bacteroidia bacterium]